MVWCLILNLLNRDKYNLTFRHVLCVVSPQGPRCREKIFISKLVVVILSEEVKFVIAHIHTFRLHILVLNNLFACLHVVCTPTCKDCKMNTPGRARVFAAGSNCWPPPKSQTFSLVLEQLGACCTVADE